MKIIRSGKDHNLYKLSAVNHPLIFAWYHVGAGLEPSYRAGFRTEDKAIAWGEREGLIKRVAKGPVDQGVL